MSNEGQSGGVNFTGGTVNIQGNVAGRDNLGNNVVNITTNNTTMVFADWRKDMEKQIEAQPNLSADDKNDLKDTVAKIEKEAAKGEQADSSRLEKLVNTLAMMGPDIFEVATTTLVNPLGGIGLVLKKIGDKAKLEKQAKI